MPETPKEKVKLDECETDEPKDDSWSEDQKKREYYYDDAQGYEVYKPDQDEDAEARTN
jgi:hypothetical protein